MAITIRDILALNSTAQFSLVAGEEGLFRVVEMVDMLESGWERVAPIVYFDRNSLVLSSFTFAQKDPEKVRDTIYGLIHCGVSGLAYKPYFFSDIPKEALQLAEDYRFPILRIENPDDAAYRDIILDITSAIRSDKNVQEKESCLTSLALGNLSREEVASSVKRISTSLLKYGRITLISSRAGDGILTDTTVPNFQEIRDSACNGVLCRFNGHFVLIMTCNEPNDKIIGSVINRILHRFALASEDIVRVHSNIHATHTEMDLCMREAIDTYIAALVLDKRDLRCQEIGVLSFLIPLANNEYVQAYQEDFFRSFLDNEEYMQTAVEFVRAEGSYEIAANRLQYHKNTVRYRISKMQDTLAPDTPSNVFFRNLCMSIYIYLILKYLPVKNHLLVEGLYADTNSKSGR